MVGVSEVCGNSDVKNPQNEVRAKRDFRLFSLITVVIHMENRGPNRAKNPGAPHAHVVNATLFKIKN